MWFRALDSLERGILTLASRVVDRVESAVLGVEIVKILRKLTEAMKSRFVKHMEEYGVIQARKLVAQAAKWGNETVWEWASDIGLIRYLTLIDMNRPSGFGV